jgi:subfamily B ATP-binding cassette protein MsbA
MERWEIARFRKAAQRLFRANLRSVAAVAISSPLMDIFGAIAIALLLLLGREQINHHVFTSGTFLTFIVAVFKLYDPVRKFALFNNNFQQALGASSEIFKFMDTEDDVKEKPGARPLPPFAHSIRFEWRVRSRGRPRNPAGYQSRSSCGGGSCRGGIEWRGQEHAGAFDSTFL